MMTFAPRKILRKDILVNHKPCSRVNWPFGVLYRTNEVNRSTLIYVKVGAATFFGPFISSCEAVIISGSS